ncbi:dapper homolog 1 [Heterocephalus glaber]|uniref:Dapper homolog 1 n=1 Tax=Heterocephalus glaber TaxID=10181 RepID=A0AAX6QL66_HETGA|nr:dapper homolog 1 [Heterocephalus glaber]
MFCASCEVVLCPAWPQRAGLLRAEEVEKAGPAVRASERKPLLHGPSLALSSKRRLSGQGTAPRAGELPGEAPRSRLEEKFLEENILLLRKQLNCLRRRDAGLLNQLQELDKQISDLRLDVEKTSEEHLEMDSRPSSGFYELSDGASGSLSNSSNSVFSECLSRCHSSTCFCSPLEATLTTSDGCPKSADVNPKYQCDLVSKNGNDVYRYPSPLHAVAVQSPMFLLCLAGSPLREEERLENHASDICVGSELDVTKTDSSLPSPSSLWPASQPSSSKKMDGYILSLVQKKTHPVRTNKPRTSVNADPTKGLLRNGSVCVRVAGSQVSSVNLKNSKLVCLPSGGMPSLDSGSFSPLKQRAKELKAELEGKRLLVPEGCLVGAPSELPSKHLPKNAKVASQEQARPAAAGAGEAPKESEQTSAASPKESPGRTPGPLKEHKAVQPLKKMAQKSSLQPAPAPVPPPLLPVAFAGEERPALDFKSEGSSQSLEEGHLVKAQFIPAQPPSSRLHRGHRNAGGLRSSTLRHRGQALQGLDSGLPTVREKTRAAGKKCRFPEDLDTNKKLKRASGRGRKGGGGAPEVLSGRPLGASGHRAGNKAQGHGREAVVAKPKHKRTDYRRWKSSAEISYEEALRRTRRGRREHVGVYPVPVPYASPYAYVASDSEYSAECESLFHSTVVDTSEDEQSNYTTNCFGDSESSVSEGEFVGESTTTSDSEESGGLIWSPFVQTLPIQTVATPNPTKTFVKIKASHTLKKKILRFRSGSLKLMTTV